MDRTETAAVGLRFFLPAILLLAVSLYWTVVPRMVEDWWKDPNFSHGFVVPLFSAYLIWGRRENLRPLETSDASYPGFFLVFLGMAALIVGKAGGEFFTTRISLVFLVGGLFILVFGRESFRKCLFPLAFLFFMVPIPYIAYDAIAFPLKMVASGIAEHILDVVGVPVLRDGNVIHLPNIDLEVADACSGIRSLMSLAALAAASGHFMKHGVPRGAALVVSAVPISIFTNSLRIVVTGFLSYHYGRKAAEGFFHEFSGWVVFLLGAFFIVLLGAVLRKGGKEKKDTNT